MTPTASPPPWSMFDIFLVLLLFFFLPGWVKSAMMLLPEEWRNERIEIRKEDLPKNISFGNNGKPGTAMAAFGNQLSEVDIAAVVTYERNALGNSVGDMLTPQDVLTFKQAQE